MSTRTPASEVPIVDAQGLTRSYPLPDRSEQRAVLRGVDLVLRPGESVLVSGASGSGKTTLMSILGGLEVPDGGALSLFGRRTRALASAELTRLRREHIGFCFQSPQLLPAMSARENALLPLVPRGQALGPVAHRIDELFEELDLAPLARARAELLSGGEQQRVALIRAFAPSPRLLLFDEPAAHLDQSNRAVLVKLLRERLDAGAALLLTSHEGFGADWVDSHLLLEEGRLRCLAANEPPPESPLTSPPSTSEETLA